MDFSTRFWSKVDKTNTCWVWKAFKNDSGYGLFSIKRHMYRAHRIAWELTNGQIPDGIEVCHHCDNPACVRPDHLFLGTQNDNIQDGINKGRINLKENNQPSGEANGKAILKNTEVE